MNNTYKIATLNINGISTTRSRKLEEFLYKHDTDWRDYRELRILRSLCLEDTRRTPTWGQRVGRLLYLPRIAIY